jgi:hypothetical protein
VPEQHLLDEGSDTIDRDMVPLNRLGNVLGEWIIEPHARSLVDSFRTIGLTPELGFRPDALPAVARSAVARGLADGAELVERKTHDLGQNVNGWTINYDGPHFGDDYLLRAAVAKDQIYVTVPKEALYPVERAASRPAATRPRGSLGSMRPGAPRSDLRRHLLNARKDVRKLGAGTLHHSRPLSCPCWRHFEDSTEDSPHSLSRHPRHA